MEEPDDPAAGILQSPGTAAATPAGWGEPAPPPPAGWGETAVCTALAAALVGASARPAFGAYFFGEAFLYLGQYWGAGERFWRALASPSDVAFFKPVCFAASLPWYFLLPPDPLAYHLRNFAFTIVNLALLHRVLGRLVASPAARAIGLGLFAASKVHLTTIGYLMIFDSIVMLGLLLLAVLGSLRWVATRRAREMALALVACALCAFSKDYGVVAVVVVAAVVLPAIGGPAAMRRAVAWVAPLALIAVARVALRALVVGPLPWWHQVYAPRLSVAEIGRKGLVFVSALTNTSVAWHDKTGASGLGRLVAGASPATTWIDALAALVLVAALAAAGLAVRRRRQALVLPLVWIAAFFAPPLLTRNVQIYYAYEPLAGAAVLLGVALADAGRRPLVVAGAAVAAIAAGGVVSNRHALYDWQYAAREAARLEAAVVAPYRGSAIRSLTVVTADVPFWRWTLSADDKAPMLELLLDRPGLPVRIYDRSILPDVPPDLPPAHVLLDADAGFARIR